MCVQDFGTCMTNKVHTREFYITNAGIIDVNYSVIYLKRKAILQTGVKLSDGTLDDRSETPPPLAGREDIVQPRRRRAPLLNPPTDMLAPGITHGLKHELSQLRSNDAKRDSKTVSQL